MLELEGSGEDWYVLPSQVNAVTGALFTSEVLQAAADEVGGLTVTFHLEHKCLSPIPNPHTSFLRA